MSNYQATADQLIEAEIWVACVDGIRDWTEPERQWIATQYDFEHNLTEWWLSDVSEGCFTPTNAEFMQQRAREYPWFQEEIAQLTNIQNPYDPETQKQFAAFVKGEPVSTEFLTELAARTGHLLTELQTRGWNPDQASEEMSKLFQQASKIFQQPHYQKQASTKDLSRPGADCLPTTESTER
ncbi:MAG TPA: hypothetical protein V6D14_10090 [Coleofasciculaceae cyanobacterium]|jgi:hypothetical protein